MLPTSSIFAHIINDIAIAAAEDEGIRRAGMATAAATTSINHNIQHHKIMRYYQPIFACHKMSFGYATVSLVVSVTTAAIAAIIVVVVVVIAIAFVVMVCSMC